MNHVLPATGLRAVIVRLRATKPQKLGFLRHCANGVINPFKDPLNPFMDAGRRTASANGGMDARQVSNQALDQGSNQLTIVKKTASTAHTHQTANI